MAATIKAPVTFTAVDKLSPTVRRMSKNISGFSAKASVGIARVEHRFNRLMRPLSRVNRMLGGFGIQLGAFGAFMVVSNGIKIFKDFEQANAKLSSVMATATAPQLKQLREDAERLGSTTAKSATEVVGLQESFARLGFETPDIINMTEATIAGSIAMNGELDQTANLVGALVKTFDDFNSQDTPKIIDALTASTQKSALSFEKLETSLPIVAGAANAAGVDMNQLLALLGKLSDSGIDASSSATSLRNIFIESASQGLSYSEILDKIVKNQDQLTAANDEFGKRASVSGVILAKNIKETEALTDALGKSGGAAQKAADKQLDTLAGALTILESAYQGFILSLENGNGTFGKLITNVVKVTSEILSMLSGSAAAKETLDGTALSIRETAETTLFWLKAIGLLIGAIITIKGLIIASKIALVGYNVVMGIHTAITQNNKRALIGNAVAQGAYRVAMIAGTVATGIATAATTAFGIALNASIWPITLIVLAIAAVIAIIMNWSTITEWFGEKWAQFTEWISKLWGKVTSFFSEFDFVEFFKSIGKSIISFMLMPMKGLLSLLSKLPGKIGNMASAGLEAINKMTADGEMNVNADSKAQVLPSTAQTSNQNMKETIKNSQVNIDVRDKGNFVERVTQDGNEIPINMNNTVGAF